MCQTLKSEVGSRKSEIKKSQGALCAHCEDTDFRLNTSDYILKRPPFTIKELR